MSYSRRSRYSPSPSPYKRYSRSVSRSLSRSRSRSSSRSRSASVAENPGNNLYVTGLSPRITKRELEKHFSSEGTVTDVHLVVDPWTRESRGFGFVTLATVREADRCIKYLNHTVLEGRVITVEKFVAAVSDFRAKRRRGRTPTPGRYLGLRTARGCRWTPSYSPRRHSYSPRRSPSYSPYCRSWSRSPRHSSERSTSRSCSPYYHRRRSYSPYYRRQRSYSPYYYSTRGYYSRSRSPYSQSPVSRRDHSYSPYDSRHSPDDRYYRRHRYQPVSRSPTPSRSSKTLRSSRRSYLRRYSPSPRRSSRRSYSRSYSPPRKRSSPRSYTRSVSPRPRKSRRSVSNGGSSRHGHSRDHYYKSPTVSSRSSRSVSRTVTSRSASPSS